MLQEINSAPRILTNYVTVMPAPFKEKLDGYLQSRLPPNFLSEMRASLQVRRIAIKSRLRAVSENSLYVRIQSNKDVGMKYNVTLMNSLVLYVGTQAIQYIYNNNSTPSMGSISKCAHMDIFQHLSNDLDTEGNERVWDVIFQQISHTTL